MWFKAFCFFIFILSSQTSFAQVTAITNASATEGTNPVTEAWGVFAGEFNAGEYSASSTQTYNNCTGLSGNFEGCHENRAKGNTAVTVTFTFSSTSGTGSKRAFAVIPATTGDTGTNAIEVASGNIITGESGATSVSFTWQTLCNKAGGSFDTSIESCDKNIQTQVAFGVATNATEVTSSNLVTFFLYRPDTAKGIIDNCEDTDTYGFCDISIIPGDSGFFVRSVTVGEVTRSNKLKQESFEISAVDARGSTANFTIDSFALRLFASENYLRSVPFSPANVSTFEYTSFDGTSVTFDNDKFEGLKNNTNYFVRGATVDSSGTVAQLFNDGTFCPGCTPTAGVACTLGTCPNYEVFPSEVAGIIEENSCFITTATYGSDQAHQVHLFRQFRKNFLFSNKLGHKVITLYNTYGPLGADWIRQNPGSQKYMRAALYPAYGFAYLSVHYGLFAAFSAYSSLVLLLLALIRLKPLKLMGVK